MWPEFVEASLTLRGRNSIENRSFALQTCQMFSVHTTPWKFKNTTINVILEFCLRKTL